MNQTSPPIVEVRDLCRLFGTLHAVDTVSFTLQTGQVIGLIGANGAGKTTLMRMLATLDQPTTGSISILGADAVLHPELIRHRIGWMPDDFNVYSNTTVRDYLDFFARAYGLKGNTRRETVARLMEFTGIPDLADRFIDKLSKGQKQKLGLARMLVGDPELLILDEPAAGLDPKARLDFKQSIHDLANQGKTILISSHILSELSEMCSDLIFMDNGKIIRSGTQEDLLQTASAVTEILIRCIGDPQLLVEWLKNREGWNNITPLPQGASAVCSLDSDEALSRELRELCLALPILEFTPRRRNLEEAFVSILSGNLPPIPSQA
ncbi:ABC transporter ATP-binding protein [Akkermansia glycaniphila]|uniref:ABC transporter ATP-binding protein n=1 Tax=Akkermansia glycaniphila TaxID=1679444 RepID=UPI001C035001|nr:ABC transporter ATP-binding protein [Akkermansia glycaniphila]MBT9450897.1 ABC transporter ATP-binding protein [Akkermansia glycaniphila]